MAVAAIQTKKFDQDLTFIMQCLAEVLEDQNYQDLIPFVPWLNSDRDIQISDVEPKSVLKLVQILSISFQLLNMIEENTTVQYRRSLQSEGNFESERGLWPWVLRKLKEQGIPEELIRKTVRTLRVEPVLTAHPTEAKRSTVLEHHRELYLQMVKRENQMWTPMEQGWVKNEIKTILERLWRTGEIYLQRPDVPSELRNVMHYMKNVFPDIIPWLDSRFETSWIDAGLSDQPEFMKQEYPTLQFGTWVGGDRDGHPLVTPDITRRTLLDLRLNALIVLRHNLVNLAKKTSISDQLQKVPAVLVNRLREYQERWPESYRRAQDRNAGESWRVLVNLMIDRLPIEVIRDHATQLDERPHCYRSPRELFEDLNILYQSLHEIGANRLANNELKIAVRAFQTFGFHTAKLDIRQNSEFHNHAIGQILEQAGIENASTYASWSKEEKHKLIRQELQILRPLSLNASRLDSKAGDVLQTYAVVRQYAEKYGWEGIGSFIVSMTHSADDLFTVYLLARESGLVFAQNHTLVCPIQVVPLFETIDDLSMSAEILDDFLSHPVSKASLEFQRQQKGLDQAIQQVMVGYSDSCKDGGIFASQWHLYLAEKSMHEVAEKHGIKLCFFHGRGGTVSRGSGPIHRFLQALPKGARNGYFRMTEQGETIARKYANNATAVFNLELLVASLTAETLRGEESTEHDPVFSTIMQRLSDFSNAEYRKLVSDHDFPNFFRQATPIDVLEHSRIGSRPPKRTGKASIEDLRAIPWVFSWNQSRFYLPSWYGVGSALAHLKEQDAESFSILRQKLSEYKLLNYILYNVETTVASASEEIMSWYASLVEDEELRQKFMSKILSEIHKTKEMLITVFGSSFDVRRPHVAKTIALREQSLRLLHRIQIQQLKEWRRHDADGQNQDQLLEKLLVTINAIASGLRNTG